MKKTTVKTLSVILSVVFILCLVSCNEPAEEVKTGIWGNAAYTKDEVVGEGAKEVKIDVVAEGKTITLTVKTDKATLGEALYELGLINDASFFDTLNGIKADWDAYSAYWAFYVGDDYATVGANETVIQGGETYKFVYTTM